MNFLAHLYLSGDDPDIQFGNFIADAVKGSLYNSYEQKIRKGILLHREIDRYTDTHPVFRKSCQRLSEKYRKYSGVIVDLYYDHFLCKNWPGYSPTELSAFVQAAYKNLTDNYELLPPRSRRILPFMMDQNWLEGYADLHKLKLVFAGMARRAKFNSGMENAVTDLVANYTLFEDEFRAFFPEMMNHSNNYREFLLTKEA